MRIILLLARHNHRLVYKTEPVQRSYIFDITLELPESRLVSRLYLSYLFSLLFLFYFVIDDVDQLYWNIVYNIPRHSAVLSYCL